MESIVEQGHEMGSPGLHQKSTFVNSIDTDEHRLTQMGNYKLLINFGRSVTVTSLRSVAIPLRSIVKRRVMDKKKDKAV